jgi:hypothetical protein
MVRTQISLDRESHARAKRRAAALDMSLAEYVRRLVDRDLGQGAPQGDISAIFGLGSSGRSDISSNVDKYVGEAVWEDHLRSTGQKEDERG